MSGGASLPAGRELDALVAERVMGASIVRPPFVPRDVDARSSVFTDAAADLWRRQYPRGMALRIVPRYSTDIAAAWQVVEQLRGSGWRVSVLLDERDRAVEVMIELDRYFATLHADTAPLAICRAALAAITGGAS